MRQLNLHLGPEMPVNIFGCAISLFCGNPPKDILLFAMNRMYLGDDRNTLMVKNVVKKVQIPRMSVGNPKERSFDTS